jgi:hypothetical protein
LRRRSTTKIARPSTASRYLPRKSCRNGYNRYPRSILHVRGAPRILPKRATAVKATCLQCVLQSAKINQMASSITRSGTGNFVTSVLVSGETAHVSYRWQKLVSSITRPRKTPITLYVSYAGNHWMVGRRMTIPWQNISSIHQTVAGRLSRQLMLEMPS